MPVPDGNADPPEPGTQPPIVGGASLALADPSPLPEKHVQPMPGSAAQPLSEVPGLTE